MRSRRLSIFLTAALTCAACSDDNGGGTGGGFDDFAEATSIVQGFSGNVVIGTYAELAGRLMDLADASATLAADPTEANLAAAQQAWVDAREPWEASEGFLFGPVDSLGIDPALDSWPVDRNALDQVLASQDQLTVQYVGNLDATLRGFHTAEYLLFGADGARTPEQLGARELDYLSAVTSLMAGAGMQLVDAWTSGVEGGPAYATVFEGAGSNATYPSLASAGEEIVRGMIGIADEVANGKIADPFDQQDTTLVESQFSFNSLTDFSNNIRSIQHAYSGDAAVAGTSGAGVDTYVAAIDPALDERLQAEIAAAIEALGAIPAPFRDAILDGEAAAAITAAQEAIRTVQTTLEQDVLPLFI